MKSLKQNQRNACIQFEKFLLKPQIVVVRHRQLFSDKIQQSFLGWCFNLQILFHYLAQVKCKNVTAIINLIYINFQIQQAKQQLRVKFALGGGDWEQHGAKVYDMSQFPPRISQKWISQRYDLCQIWQIDLYRIQTLLRRVTVFRRTAYTFSHPFALLNISWQ